MRAFASLVRRSCFLLAVSALAAPCVRGAEPSWERVRIDEVFRSEGVAAADVDRDGRMDVIHGLAWYQAPNWTIHPIREMKDYKDGAAGYSNSFVNWAYDLNGDGWTDLICIDFPGTPCYWFENPQGKEGHWNQHEIWHSAANETPLFTDVTGDGRPDLVMGSETEGLVGYLEIPAGKAVHEKWKFVAINKDRIEKLPEGTKPGDLPPGAFRYYHGLGAGDVNRDGRIDILIPHGWWEAPAKERLGRGAWTFHPLVLTRDGNPGYLLAANLYVDDLDLDGDQDILMSSAHSVGIWWFERVGPDTAPKYNYHLISDVVTQTHALDYVDMNGDGTNDLVTGKRWWAHGPKGDTDASPNADPLIAWFEIRKSKGEPPRFIPHVIAESTASGIGTQFQVVDFNGDSLPDILTSNKKGTNLLLQRRGTAAGK
jgi:hypothetical protein